MSYMLLSGLAALVVCSLFVVRMIVKASRTESGDHVTQTVLTRIKAEYRDVQ
jgi:hypothetical protein